MAITKKERDEAKLLTKRIKELNAEEAKYRAEYPGKVSKVKGENGKLYDSISHNHREILDAIRAGKTRSLRAIRTDLFLAKQRLQELVGTTDQLFDEYYFAVTETQADLDWIKEFREKFIANASSKPAEKPASDRRFTTDRVKKSGVKAGESYLIQLSGEVLEELLLIAENNTDMLNSIVKGRIGRWLREDQVAEAYNVSQRTLLKYRNEGKLPYSNPDGMNTVMYKVEDLEKFFEKNKKDINKRYMK